MGIILELEGVELHDNDLILPVHADGTALVHDTNEVLDAVDTDEVVMVDEGLHGIPIALHHVIDDDYDDAVGLIVHDKTVKNVDEDEDEDTLEPDEIEPIE